MFVIQTAWPVLPGPIVGIPPGEQVAASAPDSKKVAFKGTEVCLKSIRCRNVHWNFMEYSQYLWISMGNFMEYSQYLWLSMGNFMEYSQYLWISMGNSMEYSQYLWISMAIYGYLWLSMDIYGYLWISMDISGFFWIDLGKFNPSQLRLTAKALPVEWADPRTWLAMAPKALWQLATWETYEKLWIFTGG